MQRKLKKSEILTCIVVTLLLAVGSLLLFAACGGVSPDGTWKVDRVVVDGTTITLTATDKKGQDDIFGNEIKLNTNKTGAVKIGTASAVSATWRQEGNAIVITYGGSENTYTLSGSELTRTDGTTKIFYKKTA